MKLRMRNLARVGATALLAAGALAVTGTAALAAPGDADLALTVAGLTVAADASGKDAVATVTNRSKTETAAGVHIGFDVSDVDTAKVELVLPEEPGVCAPDEEDAQVIVCLVGDLRAGENADLLFRLVRKDGATGAAGTIAVAVAHDGADPNPENNARQQSLNVGGSGPDMYSWAWDVPLNEDGTYGAVEPGGTAPLLFIVGNQGDTAVSGLKVTVELPSGATFAEPFAGCVYGADRQTATCTYEDAVLIPEDDDKDVDQPGEQEPPFSFWGFEMQVTVAADAEHGVALTDGLVSAEALGVVQAERLRRTAPAALPAGVEGLVELPAEVDPSDDTDEFSVFVAKQDDGQGGGGGGLPVTGPQAALLGGTGSAVVLLGALLYFSARRRRVVLVAPGDER